MLADPAFADSERAKERARYARRKHLPAVKEKARDNQRKCRSGWSRGRFAELLTAQGFRCAICSASVNESSHADHDHATGAARGILCRGCNILLGVYENSTGLRALGFPAADAYLRKWEL